MALSIWNGSWQQGKNIKVWNGSEWKGACLKIWNGSTWVDIIGENGTTSTGPGGLYIGSPEAVSFGALYSDPYIHHTTAGCGIRLRINPSTGKLIITSESSGNVSGLYNVTEYINDYFIPSPCSPPASALSARVLPVSGDEPIDAGSAAINTWISLDGADIFWAIFAIRDLTETGIESKTGTFTLQLAFTSDTSTILSESTYTFSGTATRYTSEEEGDPPL